ncbi:OLC1v1013302C1 [Oldenlandia corymbosa var. corymbosa]|uniref:OLC1v1013302C1 n=1 Tax=Oldenlandia corymbosa var. corymbosa TaxID=529605 RepID=A0AAV1DXX6_OLDCO|nr:OLC1v1013302C1 [Oldenlandia corymbosa var. corymbosa]
MASDPSEDNPDKADGMWKNNVGHKLKEIPTGLEAPLQSMSFKERLIGIWKRRASSKIQIEPGDVIMEKTPMSEKLRFSERLKAIFREDWEHMVIVSLIGVTLTYGGLNNAVKRMWCPSGDYEIIDFTNGFFGVLLPSEEDEEKALRGGPWFVGPHCLSVQKWMPGFRGSTVKVNSVVTWIRLPDLPVEYYHEIALFSIGNFVGRTLKIDEKTLYADRGHGSTTCGKELRQDTPVMEPVVGIDAQGGRMEPEESYFQVSEPNRLNMEKEGRVGFGPWMVVQRWQNSPKGDVAQARTNQKNWKAQTMVDFNGNLGNKVGPSKATKSNGEASKPKNGTQSVQNVSTNSMKTNVPILKNKESVSVYTHGLEQGVKTNATKQKSRAPRGITMGQNKEISSHNQEKCNYPLLGWDSEYSIPVEGGKKRGRLLPNWKASPPTSGCSTMVVDQVQAEHKPPDPQQSDRMEDESGTSSAAALAKLPVKPPDIGEIERVEASQDADMQELDIAFPHQGN